jgi:protein involved in polysaccharide export with SLBB domain
MSDDEVARELDLRLSEYIRDPQVGVFDEEDKSRTVRVMGLVNKPGLIVLASQRESLMDALAEAGGIRDDASQRILFIPGGGAQASNSVRTTPLGSADSSNGMAIPASYEYSGATPIVMDLHDDAQRTCFELPARPGDTLIVPVAGNITVDGWVGTRGAVNLTPGMTVTGAIAAAGGALFSSKAEILRTNPNGGRTALQVDLSAIKAGQAADPPLEPGDVVIVERSVIGAGPYAVYSLLERFSSGVAIPIP